MATVVRIEDIIKIVGMNNYIAALDLDIDDLKFRGSEPSGTKQVLFNFQFKHKEENHLITQIVDKNRNVKDISCDCEHFDKENFCPHVALVIMYILANEEIIEEGLKTLNNHYDEEFNRYLFSKLVPETKKTQLNLEIILRTLGYSNYGEYELVVKIGEQKLYVLKKQLEQFLSNYQNKEETIVFGKNFTYSAKEHYFNEEDEKIIEFLKFYIDSQTDHYNGYYYSTKVTSIFLSGTSLKQFLKLLEHRKFKIEQGYRTYTFQGFNTDYPIKINMDEISDQLRVNVVYKNIEPITNDYEYFKDDQYCYHVSKEIASFLELMINNRRNQLLFKEEELKQFSKAVLPKVYQLDPQLKMSENIKNKFIMETPKVKYYIEKKKNTIQAEIKECVLDQEWNLFEEPSLYVMKNPDEEKKWEQELYQYHFQFDPKKKIFELLEEDDIISFLEEGLPHLTSNYEVYVSKNLKEVQILKKVPVTSQFGIGRNNILSYQFNIDGINKKEIKSLLDAVKLKKKYYRLKNGNYMNLEENQDLNKLNQLVEELELGSKELQEGNASIAKYKSLQVERLVNQNEMEFVQLDSSVEELIQKFNQYKNTKISLSKSDLKVLRDYQETGVKWLMTLSNCGFGGILADEMGLGKSFQTIMYIKLKLKENQKAKFLIVVPTSLIYNWENEFKKFEKGISILLMNGSKERRLELIRKAKDYQVLITTYGLLRQDLEEYKTIHFDTCIIDEAQNIKNLNAEITKSCKMINADVKFALTGTPIENSVLELFSIFDFIMPGYLPSISKFKRSYSAKMIEEHPECLQTLNQQIAPFILRRKKTEVLKDLPEKIENQVLVELGDREKKLYLAQLEKTKEQIEDTLEKEGYMKSQILILSLLTKLRQICIDSRLLLEQETNVGSKIATLVEILKGSISNGHKILVFSQFPSALHLVRQELDNEEISYYYLDGSTPSKRRMEMATSFNKDETKVFLISLKAGGTGLNLTSADVVVHLDPWWNPQVENQATDRSHRIGQKNVVEVVKLIAKGTIEEKIIELQNKKKNLSDQVIEGENRDQIILSKLTEKELRSLLDT